ncbi:hypothetical protein AMATHDRAFT_10736 [Amanita thiersii Skay4041]|uniref:Retrotransposon gag domain-containing protein n=1 Tax=Amanita thiersii Skay4041 TaxID=703135 RepID=A0A2A9N9H7_9AGAR|nr:hypothetical protein AMATHDRAFT_10736 [Amanita thiersii Skay4041]
MTDPWLLAKPSLTPADYTYPQNLTSSPPSRLRLPGLEFRTQYLESMEVDPVELLFRDIYKAFGDPNKQATAIQEITTVKQGSKSAEEHIQVFKQSYMQLGYGETAGIHEFK